MSRNIKHIVNRNTTPRERNRWDAYKFMGRVFEQRKHGNAAYDTDVDYVLDSYYENDDYAEL